MAKILWRKSKIPLKYFGFRSGSVLFVHPVVMHNGILLKGKWGGNVFCISSDTLDSWNFLNSEYVSLVLMHLKNNTKVWIGLYFFNSLLRFKRVFFSSVQRYLGIFQVLSFIEYSLLSNLNKFRYFPMCSVLW